jgi:Transposase, Mutator family
MSALASVRQPPAAYLSLTPPGGHSSSAKPCPYSSTKTAFRRLRQPATAQPQISSPPEQRTTHHVDSLRLHKIANVLGAPPKSAHPGTKKALAEIWNSEDKDHVRAAVTAFAAAYGAKFPKAVAKVTGDEDELLAFYDYPPPSTGFTCA